MSKHHSICRSVLSAKACFAILAGLLAFASSLQAQEQEDPAQQCDTRDTYVYFANGVGNSVGAARINSRALNQAVSPQLSSGYPDNRFQFREAYNPSVTTTIDLRETYRQIALNLRLPLLNEDQLMALLALSANRLAQLSEQFAELQETTDDDLSAISILARDDAPAIYSAARDAYVQAVADSIDAGIARTSNALTQLYRGNLDAGERVIIVAHSQGNLFAITSLETLLQEDSNRSTSIGVFGVATPANRTPNGGNYVTANDDRVIDTLRAQIGNVLPGNLDNDPGVLGDNRDISNHQFSRSYLLAGLDSRAIIVNDVLRLAGSLEFPEVIAGEGSMRATLTWGAQPDVDLHAFEPNGSHIYYGRKQGTSGFLDVDDVSAFGPENLFFVCDNLLEGRYRIAVNYYRGFNPESAQVQLSLADGQVFTTTIPLPVERGSEGDDSPVDAFIVDVAQNTEGILVFDVTQP